jgi:hypothetical protein
MTKMFSGFADLANPWAAYSGSKMRIERSILVMFTIFWSVTATDYKSEPHASLMSDFASINFLIFCQASRKFAVRIAEF